MKQYVLLFVTLLFTSYQARAQTISYLTVVGDDSLPGIVGEYAYDSDFSWMSHRFPDNTTRFSWTLGPGAEGGATIGSGQQPGQMTDFRLMFNQETSIYADGSGLQIGDHQVIDMSSLRMWQSGNIYDLGSGSGFDTLVPLVIDINSLSGYQNGWSMNSDGTYDLIYNTRGTCTGCDLRIHLTGVTLVPLPSSIWFMLSGLLLIFPIKRFSCKL